MTYADRVRELEEEGLTTSDAQAVADAEQLGGRVFDFDPDAPMDRGQAVNAPKPATPLPWIVNQRKHICAADGYADVATTANGRKVQVAIDDAAYIAHASNAYPRLVAALKEILGYPRGTSGRIIIECGWEERHRAMLRELGEAE